MIKIKMGMKPGDINISEKIRLLEKRSKRSKTFRNVVFRKKRAVLKRRSQQEIEEET